MSIFSRYAHYYDLLYGDKNYPEETQFIDRLIRTNVPHAEKILDLGCGTGIHADLLVNAGYAVSGVDFSHEMLHFAEERKSLLAPGLAEKLNFRRGDIRNIRLGAKFDVILSLFHVISYQVSNSDLLSAFETAKVHLKPGGKFIFDFWYGPAVLSEIPSFRVKRLENDLVGIDRIAEPKIYPNENRVAVNYALTVLDKQSGRVENHSEIHNLRYLFLPEITAMLELLDMKLVGAREWMSDREPGFETWSVYVIAE